MCVLECPGTVLWTWGPPRDAQEILDEDRMMGMCFHASLDSNSCRCSGEARAKKSHIWKTS